MDAQTMAIAVGLVVSFAFSEIYGLAAGGMIVPGYLALSLDRPGTVVLTLLAALLMAAPAPARLSLPLYPARRIHPRRDGAPGRPALHFPAL